MKTAELDFAFRFGEHEIRRGTNRRVDLEFVRLPAQARLAIPVQVIVGAEASPSTPVVWLSGAIHGDELNGVEIISRVLGRLDPTLMGGTVLAVPVVNIFGFAFQERYLPDRRDLNRSFPGSARGSLASRLAHFFFENIVEPSTHGIDLHTGSNHRTNLPQVRADLERADTRGLAQSFGAPVMIHGGAPTGSLRAAAIKEGKPILVYEAGEPMRFDRPAIDLGVDGVLRVLAALGVAPSSAAPGPPPAPSHLVETRRWVRSPLSGLFSAEVELGDTVRKGGTLGRVYEPLGSKKRVVKAPMSGIVIGHTNNPLAYQGDALVHLGTLREDEAAGERPREQKVDRGGSS